MKNLIRFASIQLLLIIFFSEQSYSINQLYRSVSSGGWNAASTWEYSTNGGTNWLPAVTYPLETDNTVTIQSGHNVNIPASQSYSINEFIINNGGTLTLNTSSLLTITDGNSTDFQLNSGGSVNGSGIMQTSGSSVLLDIMGNGLNVPLRIKSGMTTCQDGTDQEALFNNSITVDSGTVLTTSNSNSVKCNGNVINNGTISGSNSTFKVYGSSLLNNGSITMNVFDFYSSTVISGTGSWGSPNFDITCTGNLSIAGNYTMNFSGSASQRFIADAGGILNPNSFTLTFSNTGGTFGFYLVNGGQVSNSGNIQTSGTVLMDIRGNGFNAQLRINSGTTTCKDFSDNEAVFNNAITVDAGAVFTTISGHSVKCFGPVTNNGTISGDGSVFKHYGSSLVNNGSIIMNVYDFYSTTVISGTGSWGSPNFDIYSPGVVSISNNYTMNFTGSASQRLIVESGGTLNPNAYTLTFNNSGNTFGFYLVSGGVVSNSGSVQITGTALIDIRGTGLFNAPLKINSGTTTCQDFTDEEAVFNNTITVDAGAVLTTSANHDIRSNSNVINNGTITGGGSLAFFNQYGTGFVNNGIVSINGFNFKTASPSPIITNQTISGSGSFTTAALSVQKRVYLTLLSNHQFDNVLIEDSASLDLSGKILRLNGSGILINNSGNFISSGGIVECNRGSAQTLSVVNTGFVNLRINNSSGVNLGSDINVSGNLEILNGDLNTNGHIITLGTSATLSETPGNTVTGSSGYIVTTRNLGIPNNLNAANLGATLTSAFNFGSTEIRRYHGEQTIHSTGNKSITRYFIITPSNNYNLNATLVIKYDASELNGNTESISLSQYRSTNSGAYYKVENSSVTDTVNNTVTATGINTFSRHTVSNSGMINITFATEGLYNTVVNKLNMKDTVSAFIARSTFPYSYLDSAKGVLDSVTLKASFKFSDTVSGNYYLVVRHRNSLETWSRLSQPYTYRGITSYDFTTAQSQAFGNNMVMTGSKWTIYSGDINQEGIIDLTDVLYIYNDASNFINGYALSDLNGDRISDLTDILMAYNNSSKFVSRIIP